MFGDGFLGTNMSQAQFGFMAEAEGCDDLVDTPDAQFNAAIKQMKSELGWACGTDINMTSEVNNILWQHNISPSTLSKKQIARINKTIA